MWDFPLKSAIFSGPPGVSRFNYEKSHYICVFEVITSSATSLCSII